jgi:Ca-activated chloride channel family protein
MSHDCDGPDISFTNFSRRSDTRLPRSRQIAGVNIRALLLSASALLLGFGAPVRADGFIVINQPVPGPAANFAFAPLEVSYHHVEVKIDGQICTTSVDEEFYNPNPQNLEGTYLFPVPKTAQIDKFTMQINGKDASAELLAADKARAIYEDIVRRERDPALLEYADRGVFRVHVYPIEGHSRKEVKISYTEVLKADSGLVSYTYPLNTEKFSAAPIHDVSVKVTLSSDRPLTSIYSPTHDVEINRPDPSHAVVGYETKDARPDTDFQLFFAPQKQDVSLDLLTQRADDSDDGYFLLLASPGINSKAKHLPKDVAFMLDTSGSMADDDKLVQAKKALTYCISNLNADDRFEIVRFSTEAEQLFGKLSDANDANVEQAKKFVGKLQPDGGTAIFDALGQAMALRPEKSDRPFLVVFITDGMPTVGQTNDDAIVAETDKAADAGTRIFCFGLGTDVNAHLLDRIAEHTHAVSDYILPSEDLEVKVSNFFAKIREPVLANVKLTFPDGVKVSKMYPQQMPDLFQGDQLVLCGRYSGEGSGDCVIEGDAGGDHQTFKVPVTFPKTSDAQPFVPRLWASRRVAYLMDEIRLHGENAELKDEVTSLARQFGLVTPYTAYLIMQDEQGRHVAEQNQVMRDFSADKSAQASAGEAYGRFQSDASGSAAVAVAKGQNDMKYAVQTMDSLQQSNLHAALAMNIPTESATTVATAAPAPMAGASYNTVQAPSNDASTRVLQYTQRAKYIDGRAFFQNGNQWVDNNVSAQNDAKSTRIKFGSDDYFALLAKHPEARAWLALGQNVKLFLDSMTYEIYGDSSSASGSNNN